MLNSLTKEMGVKKAYVYALVIVVVVAAVIVWFLVANKGSNGNNSTNNMSNMDMSTPNPRSSASKPVAANAVTIQNFAFSPADISVKVGTKVTWTNNDSTTHTVTENDGQTGPDSGDLNPGSSYSFTFSKAGTYHYHCTLHPQMVGTVTVTN